MADLKEQTGVARRATGRVSGGVSSLKHAWEAFLIGIKTIATVMFVVAFCMKPGAIQRATHEVRLEHGKDLARKTKGAVVLSFLITTASAAVLSYDPLAIVIDWHSVSQTHFTTSLYLAFVSLNLYAFISGMFCVRGVLMLSFTVQKPFFFGILVTFLLISKVILYIAITIFFTGVLGSVWCTSDMPFWLKVVFSFPTASSPLMLVLCEVLMYEVSLSRTPSTSNTHPDTMGAEPTASG